MLRVSMPGSSSEHDYERARLEWLPIAEQGDANAQFSLGVAGGSWYWTAYLRELSLRPTWPFVEYTEGCSGGEPRIVVVGYLANGLLLWLFARFYRRAYRSRPAGRGEHAKRS